MYFFEVVNKDNNFNKNINDKNNFFNLMQK